MRIKMMFLAVLSGLLLIGCIGCIRLGKDKSVKRAAVDYVVCDNTMLPDELMRIIDDRKDDKFTLSYNTNEYTYIAIGYGLHSTDGYMVELKDIFATDKACYVECSLISREYVQSMGTETDGERVCSEPSVCPYIVLKCNKLNLPVVYYAP